MRREGKGRGLACRAAPTERGGKGGRGGKKEEEEGTGKKEDEGG